ncbi:ABC-F family ATP-binding cassette domain-containing protein [Thermodesulfobacteriota bacterium]
MSLVSLLNVSLHFLGKPIFQQVVLQLEPGERIGLVGPNGSGKTTLLRLIVGEQSVDSGQIRVSEGIRIGYLPQDVHESPSGSLHQTMLDTIPGRTRIRHEIEKIEEQLRQNLPAQQQEKWAERLAERHLDISFPAYQAEETLCGLGFKTRDFDKSLALFSEGWKMRATLGRLLYQRPDLLLLDEPTNHLDIPSVRWLEQFLGEYKGALVLISHDRDFLNRQIRRVISFEPEGLRSYSGNYDLYLKSREEEKKTLDARNRKQEMKKKEAEKFIERFRAKATKARQAQSKIKLVEKMELVKTYRKPKIIRFSFPEVSRSGRVVINIQGLSKGFEGRDLYSGIELTVLRGERVAIIGPNGYGKTTLLRMVAGEADPDRGRIIPGHGVAMSYYAQHHSDMLDPKKTILEEVYQAVPHESIGFVRSVCGAFLFSGDDVEKRVGILSGGEKARVCLARILVNPGNLLVMDEPTNHLDLLSSEILIEALAGYNGTLLFVSHNQSFINRLATKIWDIRDEGIVEYPGSLYDYYDYTIRMEQDRLSDAQTETDGENTPLELKQGNDRASRKEKRRMKAEERRKINTTLKPIQDGLSKLEERIAELESREKKLGKELADPDIFSDKKKSLPIIKEYGEVREELETLIQRWEDQQHQLESALMELESSEG